MRKDLGASRTSLKRMSAGGVVLALVALFGLPTAAFAAGPTVVDIPGGATGTTLTATAAVDQRNAILVGNTGPVAGGGISIRDTGPTSNGVTLGAGAVAAGCVTALSGDEARCPLGDLTAATVNMGDVGDSANIFNDDVVVTVNAGAGNDDLRGGPGNDVLNGDADDDELRGGSGGDILNGGTEVAGDTINYGSASAAVQVTLDNVNNDGQDVDLVTPNIQPEGDNVTEAEIVEGSSHGDFLTGDADSNTLRGNNGDDDLDGAGGDDTLEGGNGADDFVGGAGTADTVNYNPEGDDLTITVDNNPNDGANGGGEGDNVRDDNEVITGGVGDDSITGSAAAETLNGGTGNDTLVGLGGADVLNGGGGTDTASYAGLAGGTITLDGLANDPGGDNVQTENVIGGTGVDNITGNAGVNRLDGREGGDTVDGEGGNDTLVGGAGDGADTYVGGSGRDTVTYAAVAAGVNVQIGGASVTDGDNIGASVEVLTGGDGNDTLAGNASANTLNGGLGDDTLFGNDGNDVLNGQRNDDTLNGGANTDTLNGGNGPDGAETDADDLNGGAGIDTVRYSTRTVGVSVTIAGGVANDGEPGENDNVSGGVEKIFGSPKADTLTGDATPESLTGGAGDDTINGAGGADILSGQGGDDILTGGGAKDSVSGGPGGDIFHTQDGLKDSLNCGDGDDNIADTDAIDSKTANCVP